MKVKIINENMIYEDLGSIKFIEGKVIFDFDPEGLFDKVMGSKGVFKYPKDGMEYLRTVVEQFSRSTSVDIILEEQDKIWMEE